MCDPARCSGAAGERDEQPSRVMGNVTASVTLFIDALRLSPEDTRAPIAATLIRLAEAIDDGRAEHLPGLTREFRTELSWLSEMGAVGDGLDELRARRAQRRVQELIGAIDATAS